MKPAGDSKPLAALLVEEKGPPKGAPDEGSGDGEDAMAVETAAELGAKDPSSAGSMLLDVIRACIAKSKAGKY